MKSVSIHQPGYLPWLGYFEKIAAGDVHVFLDTVQFEKNSFDNRNRIRTHTGSLWLTVPVVTRGKFGENTLREAELDTKQPWRKKHWKTLSLNYAKAPFFSKYAAFFEETYNTEWTRLLDLNLHLTRYVLSELGLNREFIMASDLNVEGRKSELVLNICKATGATTYVSGALGKDYLELESFQENGIRVVFQDYAHPQYTQMFPGFVSHLSIVDLLFNHGPESLNILLNRTKA